MKKLILHIGQQKTGTSVLQSALSASRETLIENDILYPVPFGKEKNHNALVCDLFEKRKWPRMIRSKEENNSAYPEESLSQIKDQIRKFVDKRKSAVVVLSAENMFRKPDMVSLEGFRERWLSVFDEVSIAVYLRRPADWFLSNLQQRLKASSSLRVPAGVHFRSIIEAYQSVGNVTVIKYDRSTMVSGDIVQDFECRFLPDYEGKIVRDSSGSVNRSLSPEAMSVLQSYRSVEWSDFDDKPTQDTRDVRRRLEELCAEEEFQSRPRLNESVEKFVDEQSIDLLWLRDRWGVEFDNVNYNNLGRDKRPHLAPKRLEDLCFVDSELRERLLMRLLGKFAKSQ